MSSLEEKVEDKESNRFIRKAGKLLWKTGMAAATTALSMATVGTLGVLVGGAFAAGGMMANLARGKSLYDAVSSGLTTYSAVNAVIYPMVWLGNATFPFIPNADLTGKIMRGLYASTIYNAAFVGLYKGAGHLVDNYFNPKGIAKTIKTNFFRDWWQIGLMFSPFYYLASNNLAQIAMYHPLTGYNAAPTFAVGAVPVGLAHTYINTPQASSH